MFSRKLTLQSIKNGNEIHNEIIAIKEENSNKHDELKIVVEDNTTNLYGINKKSIDIEPTAGSFDFYSLGEPMFGEDKMLNENIALEKIRLYVYYTETQQPLTVGKPDQNKDNSYLLDKYNATGYYFFYEKEEMTTLNNDFLATIKTKADQYVIYADNCLLSKEFMLKKNIVFKKIPRDITRF